MYGSDWAGPVSVLAVDPTHPLEPREISSIHPFCTEPGRLCGFADPVPSPNGRHVLFRTVGGEEIWLRSAGRPPRLIARGRHLPFLGTDDFAWTNDFRPFAAWTRDSRLVAYTATDGLHIARGDGSADRIVDHDPTNASPSWAPSGRALAFVRTVGTGFAAVYDVMLRRNGRTTRLTSGCQSVSWSADGRFLACLGTGTFSFTVKLLDKKGRAHGPSLNSIAIPAWSPTGSRLALGFGVMEQGIRMVNAPNGRSQVLTADSATALAWAPDGRSIAYVSTTGTETLRRTGGDLRVVSLAGRKQTLVHANDAGGGTLMTIAWTRNRAATRWSPASPGGTLADGPVDALATAGDRIAYEACGLPYLWTPGTAPRLLPPPSMDPIGFRGGCRSFVDRFRVYTVALSRNAALYGWCVCPMGYTSVQAVDLQAWTSSEAGRGSGSAAVSSGYGTIFGDQSLLVFSGWDSRGGVSDGTRVVRNQRILRVDSPSCPCPVIAEAPQPLQPLDVDQRRLVVRHARSTSIRDANGAPLLSLLVDPIAAQLSGRDLIILLPRELRRYDAFSGELVRTWALPAVEVGRECQGWFDPGCFVGRPLGDYCDATGFNYRDCLRPRLRLEDAARGLVSYILDGRVHILRLSDGEDSVVDFGTIARFTDSGLVYADGARLHLVRFEQLP